MPTPSSQQPNDRPPSENSNIPTSCPEDSESQPNADETSREAQVHRLEDNSDAAMSSQASDLAGESVQTNTTDMDSDTGSQSALSSRETTTSPGPDNMSGEHAQVKFGVGPQSQFEGNIADAETASERLSEGPEAESSASRDAPGPAHAQVGLPDRPDAEMDIWEEDIFVQSSCSDFPRMRVSFFGAFKALQGLTKIIFRFFRHRRPCTFALGAGFRVRKSQTRISMSSRSTSSMSTTANPSSAAT